jgi:hypothetical protein
MDEEITTLPVAVANWIWTSSTVVAVVVTVELLAVLIAHVLVSAAAGPRARLLRRRLALVAIPLLGCFVVVIGVRLAIILMERPGP